MTSLAQRSLAASRPARSTLPAIAAAEVRQRHLRLVHSARDIRPAPSAAVRTTKRVGAMLAVAAAMALVFGAL